MSHPVSRTTGPITVSFSGFELCSLPWILLPTSLASGPHSIELNVRGCFVIQLSTCSVLSRSVLLPRKLLYFTIVLRICQELFSSFLKIFTFSIRLYFLRNHFFFLKSGSCATKIILPQTILCVKHFFGFFYIYFLTGNTRTL